MGLCELDEGAGRGLPPSPSRRLGGARPRRRARRSADRGRGIATPPHTHYPLVRRALEAGKHVLVEKPLARTAEEAAELIALADEAGGCSCLVTRSYTALPSTRSAS